MNTRYLLRLAAVMVVASGAGTAPLLVMAQGFGPQVFNPQGFNSQGFNPMGWMDPARWMNRHGYGEDYGYGVPGHGAGAAPYSPAYGFAYPSGGYGYGAPYGRRMAPAYSPGYAPALGLPSRGQGPDVYGAEPTPRRAAPDREKRSDADDATRSHGAPGASHSGSGIRDPWLEPAPRSDGTRGTSRSRAWDGAEGSAWPPAEPSPGLDRGEGGRYEGSRQGGLGRTSGWGTPKGYEHAVPREDFIEARPGAPLPPAAIEWPDRSRGAGQGGRGGDWGAAAPARDLPHGGRWPSGER